MKNILKQNTSKIIFIIGPSGVGKTSIANDLKTKLNYYHLDIDVPQHFNHYQLNDYWKIFTRKNDFSEFLIKIQDLYTNKNKIGVIISLLSTKRLSKSKIDILESKSIVTIILWGSKEFCIKSKANRDKMSTFNHKNYDKKNDPLFNMYGDKQFDHNRISVFNFDGTHRKMDSITDEIIQLLNC